MDLRVGPIQIIGNPDGNPGKQYQGTNVEHCGIPFPMTLGNTSRFVLVFKNPFGGPGTVDNDPRPGTLVHS